MNDNIYIIGHKHPDSDSICAAITYADFLEKTGGKAIACRQGPLNEETKFILKRFHQENPLLITDARAKLSDIDLDVPEFINEHDTVHHAWHIMLRTQYRSLIVLNDEGEMVGVVTTSDLSMVRIHPDADLLTLMSTCTLENIARTVGGKVVVAPENFHTAGYVHVITLEGREAEKFELSESICILSSNEDKQRMVLERGATCLVVTCGVKVSDEIKKYALQHHAAVIETDIDTMNVARVVQESYSVSEIMSRDIVCYNENEYVEDAMVTMMKSRVRSYPVLSDAGKVIGACSRYHTRNYERRKFVLVDHSAINQTISNIDQADLQAIIDHHHIGGIMSSHPILYRNEQCGCTCTIINEMYEEHGITPSPDMAGLMLSAILSDTLNFKSATTTKLDKETVRRLAKIAGIDDVNEYAREMLGAGVALSDSTPHDILNRDLKFYEIGRFKFAIGQTNYSHMEEVQKILPVFRENMEKEQAINKLDLMVMLFTDVMGEGSLFVFYGPMSYVLSDVIETKFDDHSGFDPSIISRKQQLMPKLSQIMKDM